jgi:outer membrane protein assembly factor BamB
MRNLTNLRFFQLRRFLLAVSAFSISAFLSLANDQGDWPNWRGPNGNGSVDTGKYPVKWDPDNVLWKVPLPGKGTSTPIVWKERIYLTSPSEGEDAVLAFDFSGKLLWQTKLGPEMRPKHRQLASSSNASPVTDGTRLFVYFKSGNFAALEFDGSARWQINLVERFGADQLVWDQGTSPVVTEKHVVMARMHGGPSWIAGFDKETGEMHWQQPRNYKTPPENDNAYTTPVVYERDGREALLVWGADHLTAHDAANGKLLWFSGNFNPGNSRNWPAIAIPVIVGNIAVVPVGRDDRPGQAHVHGIKMGGSGNVTGTHRVWKRDDLGVFAPSPAEYKGRVYLLRDRGELVCIDPASGKTIWSEAFPTTKDSYYASPIIANGLLYAARQDGTVFVARVEDKFELLSEIPMGEQIIATPVAVRNRLLIRGSENLFCVAGD